jgi:hypothetical protein
MAYLHGILLVIQYHRLPSWISIAPRVEKGLQAQQVSTKIRSKVETCEPNPSMPQVTVLSDNGFYTDGKLQNPR